MSGIAGPLIGAAGSLLGGLFGGGNPGYKYPGVGKFTHNQLRAYRKYGEKFGFHPLELLRSGAGLLGGGGGSGATSGVATQAAIAGTFDAIDDVLTGRSAKEQARQEVEDDLNRIRRDRAAAELDMLNRGNVNTFASPAISTGRVGGPSTGRASGGPDVGGDVVLTDQGLKPKSELKWPTPIKPDGSLDVTLDDGGTNTTKKPRERIVASDGSTWDFTAGLEWDEFAAGMIVESLAFGSSELDRLHNKNNRYTRWNKARTGMTFSPWASGPQFDPAPPLAWSDNYPGEKPPIWDNWDNETKWRYVKDKWKK
jgi:hypothetical protein